MPINPTKAEAKLYWADKMSTRSKVISVTVYYWVIPLIGITCMIILLQNGKREYSCTGVTSLYVI